MKFYFFKGRASGYNHLHARPFNAKRTIEWFYNGRKLTLFENISDCGAAIIEWQNKNEK